MQNNKCVHELIFRQYEPFSYPLVFVDKPWMDLSEEEKNRIHNKTHIKDALMRCSEHCGNTVRDK